MAGRRRLASYVKGRYKILVTDPHASFVSLATSCFSCCKSKKYLYTFTMSTAESCCTRTPIGTNRKVPVVKIANLDTCQLSCRCLPVHIRELTCKEIQMSPATHRPNLVSSSSTTSLASILKPSREQTCSPLKPEQ